MFLNAVQFHKIYTECFINSQTSYNADAYYTAQYELSKLLVIDNNQDEKIVEIMKNMRAGFADKQGFPENPTLSRFMVCSANLKIGKTPIKNGEAFWKMFSSSLPFDNANAVPIQKLAVKRFQELQKDFHEKLKGQSLMECLSNPNFFDQPEETEVTTYTEGGYYKEGAISKTPIVYSHNREQTGIDGNMYSEQELDRLPKDSANQLRNIRDTWTRRALQGEVITDTVIVDRNPFTGRISFSLVENKNIVVQYAVTMKAIIYEEVKNGHIRTRLEADAYVTQTLLSDPRFRFAFDLYGREKFEQIVASCRDSMKYFNDAYAQYAQQSSSSSLTSSSNSSMEEKS